MISCRHCRKPCKRGNAGLCTDCHAVARRAGHGSTEYRRNADQVRRAAEAMLMLGIQLFCGICQREITLRDVISIDHIIRLRDGGSHRVENLRPVHQHCNSSDH